MNEPERRKGSVALFAVSGLQDGSLRERARLDVAPQRDEELPCERDDPDLAGPGPPRAKRSLYQCVRALSGWWRSQPQAISMARPRTHRLPARLMPSS